MLLLTGVHRDQRRPWKWYAILAGPRSPAAERRCRPRGNTASGSESHAQVHRLRILRAGALGADRLHQQTLSRPSRNPSAWLSGRSSSSTPWSQARPDWSAPTRPPSRCTCALAPLQEKMFRHMQARDRRHGRGGLLKNGRRRRFDRPTERRIDLRSRPRRCPQTQAPAGARVDNRGVSPRECPTTRVCSPQGRQLRSSRSLLTPGELWAKRKEKEHSNPSAPLILSGPLRRGHGIRTESVAQWGLARIKP